MRDFFYRCQGAGCISFCCAAANFYVASLLRKILSFIAVRFFSMCYYVPMTLCVIPARLPEDYFSKSTNRCVS